MKPWPKHPVIYEINTWVWVNELSRKYERPVTLAAVPSATTPATVRNCLLGSAAGVGQAYTAATLPAAPVIARVMPGGIYWATAAAAAAPMVAEDWVDGSLILAPNSALTIQGVGVATSGIVSLMWEEIPS